MFVCGRRLARTFFTSLAAIGIVALIVHFFCDAKTVPVFEELSERYGYAYHLPACAWARFREREFGYLSPDEAFVDYTGSALYTRSQVDAQAADLRSNLYCNAHSTSPCSIATDRAIEATRARILRFFNAPPGEYSVIFTSGTTGALHLLADAFPWTPDSLYAYTRQNHNSVLGVRSVATFQGAQFTSLDVGYDDWSALDTISVPNPGNPDAFHLFAFPAESNFDGGKLDLGLIEEVQSRTDGQWRVLLDAAAYIPSNPLDLSVYKPDYVTMSFYKLFGTPTGIGALLVRNAVGEELRKATYWGGGTVRAAACQKDACLFLPALSSKFEDGTVNFLSIIALNHGFDVYESLGGVEAVQGHVYAVAEYFATRLQAMRHDNGRPLARLASDFSYGMERQGGIVTFDVLDTNSHFVGYAKVASEASAANIHLRGGCACNPGACLTHIGLNEDEVLAFAAQHETKCGGGQDMLGRKPLGALRVSFGYGSSIEDADKVLRFLSGYKNTTAPSTEVFDELCSAIMDAP
jgi:molybdenum cofactor sulfurtransferase